MVDFSPPDNCGWNLCCCLRIPASSLRSIALETMKSLLVVHDLMSMFGLASTSLELDARWIVQLFGKVEWRILYLQLIPQSQRRHHVCLLFLVFLRLVQWTKYNVGRCGDYCLVVSTSCKLLTSIATFTAVGIINCSRLGVLLLFCTLCLDLCLSVDSNIGW